MIQLIQDKIDRFSTWDRYCVRNWHKRRWSSPELKTHHKTEMGCDENVTVAVWTSNTHINRNICSNGMRRNPGHSAELPRSSSARSIVVQKFRDIDTMISSNARKVLSTACGKKLLDLIANRVLIFAERVSDNVGSPKHISSNKLVPTFSQEFDKPTGSSCPNWNIDAWNEPFRRLRVDPKRN
jgi:hypothetical protein